MTKKLNVDIRYKFNMLKIQVFLFLQPISYNPINTFTSIYCASYYLPGPGGGVGQ